MFNYVDGTWAYGSIGRSGWSDSGIREKPNAAYDKGEYTSGVYSGINRSIIYNHEDGYMDDESEMDSYIESGYFDIEDGDSSIFIDRLSPDFRGLESTSPQLTVDIKAKNYPFSSTSMTRTLTATLSTEFISARLRGRTMSLMFYDSPNTTTETAGWELGDSRIRMKPDGRR